MSRCPRELLKEVRSGLQLHSSVCLEDFFGHDAFRPEQDWPAFPVAVNMVALRFFASMAFRRRRCELLSTTRPSGAQPQPHRSHTVCGQDIELYWPTAAGKSLVFQLLAVLAWQRTPAAFCALECPFFSAMASGSVA